MSGYTYSGSDGKQPDKLGVYSEGESKRGREEREGRRTEWVSVRPDRPIRKLALPITATDVGVRYARLWIPEAHHQLVNSIETEFRTWFYLELCRF